MKKNKGFTLIELLAIIVILAIIAVITIPMIFNAIKKSKIGAATNSAYGYIEAIDNYFLSNTLEEIDNELDGEYSVDDGKLNGENIENLEIPITGAKPSNGTLIYENNKLSTGCLVINDFSLTYENNEFKYNDQSCLTTYTLTFNSNGGSEVASIETYPGISITAPTIPTKNESVFRGWYKDEELTQEFNFKKGIRIDTTVYAKWVVPSFATDSWSEIKENLIANRNAYPIGATKVIQFDRDNNGTNEYYKLRLVNTAPCGDYTGSRTACGVVIEFVTTVGTHKMNTGQTNAGGWYASSMRSYLNTTIYDKLNAVIGKDSSDNDIIISTTPVVSSSGYGNNTNGGGESANAEDYLYLLSPKEVGYTSSETYTKKLKYYNSNNNSDARKKFGNTTDAGAVSSPKDYWLRSAYADNEKSFHMVCDDGWSSWDSANNSYGVAPVFRILD